MNPEDRKKMIEDIKKRVDKRYSPEQEFKEIQKEVKESPEFVTATSLAAHSAVTFNLLVEKEIITREEAEEIQNKKLPAVQELFETLILYAGLEEHVEDYPEDLLEKEKAKAERAVEQLRVFVPNAIK